MRHGRWPVDKRFEKRVFIIFLRKSEALLSMGASLYRKGIIKKLEKLLLAVRKAQGTIIEQGDDGFACQLSRRNYNLYIVLSWGAGWDHVSVHAATTDGKDFTPFWEDMCYVKNLFFKPSEMAVQYHPVNDKYVNVHTNTLHLWRPQKTEIELPPIWMV